MAVGIGTGCTLTFGTAISGLQITSVSASGISAPIVDVSYMGSTNYRTKKVGDLIDPGTLTFGINFDPTIMDTTMTSFLAGSQTVTVDFPGGEKVTGTGAISDVSWDAPLEDRMSGTITVSWLGGPTYSDT